MANKNRIKVARSVTRSNLPGVLDYGELGFVNNTELIIGNADGSDFIVNDYNNLVNKPASAGPETTLTLTADESIQAYRAIRIKTTGKAVRASKNSTTLARVVGISIQAAALDEDFLVQTEGTITNSGWSFTPGSLVYLGNTVGDLTEDISGFADTDAITLVGIAISATEIALNIGSSIHPETGETPNLVQTVADGDTNNAPSADAIYDFVTGITGVIAGNVSTNATAISSNETNIQTNIDDIAALETRMDDAETDITDNATEISNNAGDIATNASNISANAASIGINATNITNLTSTVNSIVVQTITDGDTTHAPSADAVYDFVNAQTPPWAGSVKTAGHFYTGTTDPTNSDRLNYDGNLYVNDLHTNAASLYIGGHKISTDTGVLTYKPDADIDEDYEVVTTQINIGGVIGNDITPLKGEIHFRDGDLIFNKIQEGLATTPTRNANIFIERGNENNVGIRWNEVTDTWEATIDGSQYFPFAFLDINGKIPSAVLPSSVTSSLEYIGTWQAGSGVWPSTPEKGHYWIISQAGTIDTTELSAGDWIVFNGDYWDKIDNTERVTSVAGKTGNIVLTPADVGLDLVSNVTYIQSPSTSTAGRLVRWNNDNGSAVNTAPVSVSEDAELTLHGINSKITIDREGAGTNPSIRWDESGEKFVATAPIEAPNIPATYENTNMITADVPNFITVSGAQSVRFDVVISDRFAQNVRYDSIQVVAGYGKISWSVTSAGPGIGDTSAIQPEITLDNMDLVLGFTVESGSWTVVVTPHAQPYWGGSTITYSKGIA